MKLFTKTLLLLMTFLSCMESAIFAGNFDPFQNQAKLYFDPNDLEFNNVSIYIRLGDCWVETKAIQTDEQGFYIFENDIAKYEVSGKENVKYWKCPYCYHYWPIGQACQNPDCPSKYK